MAFLMSTSAYPPPWLIKSRRVVNPARKSFCALASARSVRYSRVSLIGLANGGPPGFMSSRPYPKTWVCPSISPGSTVLPPRSITCAPGGICTRSGGPTAVILSSSTRITWFSTALPDLLSNNRPARIAVTCVCARTVVAAKHTKTQVTTQT